MKCTWFVSTSFSPSRAPTEHVGTAQCSVFSFPLGCARCQVRKQEGWPLRKGPLPRQQHSTECSPPAWDMLSRKESCTRFSTQDSLQLTWSQWHPERVQDLGKVSCGNLETISVTFGFVTLKCRLYIGQWSGQEMMVIFPFFKESASPTE